MNQFLELCACIVLIFQTETLSFYFVFILFSECMTQTCDLAAY